MKVLVPKPDFGVAGGFERVLERVKDHLRRQGHDVVDRRVDATRPSRAPFGLEVPPHVWNQTPEYFRYIALG